MPSVRVIPIVLVLALTAASCRPQPPDEGSYADRISAARTVKDVDFQRSSESPIPPSRKDDLLPLPYYPIDPGYNVPAALEVFEDVTIVDMVTSTGAQEKYRRVGELQFTLKGQPLTLTAFVAANAPNMDRLFVPFSDQTSGTETYGSGRYLDLDRTATGMYAVDFNLAYNPYCYYNPTWVCPLPPRENRLRVRIEAGEKTTR